MKGLNTTGLGKAAEALVAEHLKAKGYEIIELNWRRRTCEVDIIAKKDKVVFLVEVKYRTSASQGGGLDYITPAKLRQLKFAAQLWVAENNWPGDIRLMAGAVNSDGLQPVLEQIVEITD